MNTKKLLIVLLMLAVAVAFVGCGPRTTGTTAPTAAPTGGSTGGGTAAGATIVEEGFAFDPATLDVKVGDTVTFTNKDSASHQVTIDGKNLDTQATGASVTWKAEKAGTFPYSCTIHPSMTGEIVVK